MANIPIEIMVKLTYNCVEVIFMAEFCAECFSKIFDEKVTERNYILSKDFDLCEECGEWKRVVVRVRHPRLYMWKMRVKARLEELKRKK